MTLAVSASMLAPVSVYAAETTSEVDVDNHTQGRENAKTVSGITIGDVDAPKEGTRLDDKAVVTTAEGETWEIPVIWIDENLEPDTGIAGKGSYLPVLAYVVPDEYTIISNDKSGRGYKITLSDDLLKLFGENKIISIYENKTRITYILPAKLKDLYSQKGTVKNPTDSNGNEIVPEDQVAPYEDEEEPAQEQKEEPEEPAQEEEEKPAPEQQEEDDTKEEYSRIVNVHCNSQAKEALSNEALEFLANLVVNTLQPKAVNLLIKKFPAFETAAQNKEIGDWVTVVISYDEGSSTYGYATPGRTVNNDYPEHRFVYSLTVNAVPLIERTEDGNLVITEDVNSESLTNLANTVVHELFHIVSFDYNRPGLTGWLCDGNLETLKEYTSGVEYPSWFVEGTAATVENNWQFRQSSLEVLRTPFREEARSEFSKDVLLYRYTNGRFIADDDGNIKCDYNFDIQYSDGEVPFFDGEKTVMLPCSTVDSRYVSGYLACMYLYELAASKETSIGSSKSTVDGKTVFSSKKLRLGMNSILKRMHEGETLDQVINDISDGHYGSTKNFEQLFIKGEGEQKGGDEPSLNFVCDFMNYMNDIDKTKGSERNDYANGSVLFDFETDFRSPLSFEDADPSIVLKPLDDEDGQFQRFARSTVKDSFAYSTGGQSLSGKQAGSSNSGGDNVLTFTPPAQESSVAQEAAKEVIESVVGGTTQAVIESEIMPSFDENAVSEASSESSTEAAAENASEGSAAAAAESASEGSAAVAAESASEGSSAAVDESIEAPAPEAVSEAAPETIAEPAPEAGAETAQSAESSEEVPSEGESSAEEEAETAPSGETAQTVQE